MGLRCSLYDLSHILKVSFLPSISVDVTYHTQFVKFLTLPVISRGVKRLSIGQESCLCTFTLDCLVLSKLSELSIRKCERTLIDSGTSSVETADRIPSPANTVRMPTIPTSCTIGKLPSNAAIATIDIASEFCAEKKIDYVFTDN